MVIISLTHPSTESTVLPSLLQPPMTSFISYHPQTQVFLDKKPWKQTFTKILLTENVPKEKHALSLQNKKILHLVEAQETSWLAQKNLSLILRNTPNQNAIYKIDHLMKIQGNFQQWNPIHPMPPRGNSSISSQEVGRCSAWAPWPSSMDFNFRRTPQMSCPRYPPKSCLSRCPRPVSYR